MAEYRRRAMGEDAIYFDHRGACRDALKHRHCPGRWLGVVSLGCDADGNRIRRKVYGRTKTDVKDKLKQLHEELDQGIKTSASYTVEVAVADWLDQGLDGRSAKTTSTNREVLAPALASRGKIPLRELTAADVRTALTRLAATRSTRTVTIARSALTRAVRHAEANDLVRRNVAALVTPPKGLEGRPSKSLTLRQARALMKAAETSRLHVYIALCLLTGCRAEEARALRWDHVDLDGDPTADPPVPPHVAVWRSVRSHGDVKTQKSRRTLRLPIAAVEALKAHKITQAADKLLAGALWQDNGLVFASQSARRSTLPTSGAASGRSVRPPGSAQSGAHGSCGTLLSRS